MSSRSSALLALVAIAAPVLLAGCARDARSTTAGPPATPLTSTPLTSTALASTAASSKPAISKPASSKPASSKPASSKPAISKPAISKPVLNTSPSASTPPGQAGSTPVVTSAITCRTSSLALSAGALEHAAGSAYLTYYLRNTGRTSCRMFGFPGVSYLDAQGRIIQRPAERDTVRPLAFMLAPGVRAQFVVRTSDPAIPGTGCSTAWHTTRIQVYPPNQTTRLVAPSSLQVCDLLVRPVQPVG
ncbi:MAG: DUF4232 domain-containing protein [Jatrophihabitans sp.]